MKKLTTLFTLMAGIGIAFSQGTVSFVNSESAGGDHKVYADTVGGTALTGTNYVAELYFGTDAASLQPLVASISKFRVSTTASPGTWSNPKSYTLTIGGVNVPIPLDVRVWDASLFSTYEAAKAAGGITGESGAFTYLQVLSNPPAPTDTQMVNQPAFALVPEPSAVALSVLGVAGLLFLPRRK